MMKKRTMREGEPSKLKQLHDILWEMWNIWKEIAQAATT
jgi:hypothetical protein